MHPLFKMDAIFFSPLIIWGREKKKRHPWLSLQRFNMTWSALLVTIFVSNGMLNCWAHLVNFASSFSTTVFCLCLCKSDERIWNKRIELVPVLVMVTFSRLMIVTQTSTDDQSSLTITYKMYLIYIFSIIGIKIDHKV